MLLFSTVLKVNENLNKDNFIALIIRWNQESPYDVNVIHNIEWNGEHNVRYEEGPLWLQILEYKNIIAARYEKTDEDGVVWVTDFVANFDEMKLSIRLDRTYKDDSFISETNFSTPHFISLLIECGYLKRDVKLAVKMEPVIIRNSNIRHLADIIDDNVVYELPIVYISKTRAGSDPVDVALLAKRLKGVAHVLVEKNRKLNKLIKKACHGKVAENGDINVIIPHITESHRYFSYKAFAGNEKLLFDEVIRVVFRYLVVKNLSSIYTWQGVYNAELNDKLANQRKEMLKVKESAQKKEDDSNKLIDAFDDEMAKLEDQVKTLTNENERLELENAGIRDKLNSIIYGNESKSVPIVFMGDEPEFFEGETKEIVIETLKAGRQNIHEGSRRAHVLDNVIAGNKYDDLLARRKKEVSKCLRGYKEVSPKIKKTLTEAGVEISEGGKHYILHYYGDVRYKSTMAKTPSDSCSGDNLAKEICRDFL